MSHQYCCPNCGKHIESTNDYQQDQDRLEYHRYRCYPSSYTDVVDRIESQNPGSVNPYEYELRTG